MTRLCRLVPGCLMFATVAFGGAASAAAQEPATRIPAGHVAAEPSHEGQPSTDLTAEHLVQLRDIGGKDRGAIRLSPDGRWVAFQLQEPDLDLNSFRLRWLAVRADGLTDVRPLGDGGELIQNPNKYFTSETRPTVRGTWAPDSEALYYLKMLNGETQVWRTWIESGAQEQVTRNAADVLEFRISDDGSRILYSVARPDAELAHELTDEGLRGYLVDNRLEPMYAMFRPVRLSCDGSVSLFSLARTCDPEVRVFDLTTANERIASREERDVFRAPLPSTTSNADVRARLQPDGLVYECHVHSGRATCLHESSTTPARIVTVDLAEGSMETLYDPNPEWRAVELTAVERIEWTDEFGNARHGHLVYPRGFEEGVRYPLVVTPYLSSGFLRGDVGDEYPIHLFAHAGMMVLDVARPSPRDVGMLRNEEMNHAGLMAAVNMLADRGLIDRACIGMTGLSAAARHASYALINSDMVAAASVSSLMTPEAQYYLGTEYVRALLRDERAFGGSPLSGSEFYDRLSLARNAGRVSAPILANVSDEELLLSFPALVALQDAGKPVEMHVFPQEHHQKWRPVHRLNIYRRNVQWFEFWLMGREDPEPIDSAQYERWRTLRARHEARGEALCTVPGR